MMHTIMTQPLHIPVAAVTLTGPVSIFPTTRAANSSSWFMAPLAIQVVEGAPILLKEARHPMPGSTVSSRAEQCGHFLPDWPVGIRHPLAHPLDLLPCRMTHVLQGICFFCSPRNRSLLLNILMNKIYFIFHGGRYMMTCAIM